MRKIMDSIVFFGREIKDGEIVQYYDGERWNSGIVYLTGDLAFPFAVNTTENLYYVNKRNAWRAKFGTVIENE